VNDEPASDLVPPKRAPSVVVCHAYESEATKDSEFASRSNAVDVRKYEFVMFRAVARGKVGQRAARVLVTVDRAAAKCTVATNTRLSSHKVKPWGSRGDIRVSVESRCLIAQGEPQPIAQVRALRRP
jgi:hypothetical protein